MEQGDRVPIEGRVAFRTEDGVHLRRLFALHVRTYVDDGFARARPRFGGAEGSGQGPSIRLSYYQDTYWQPAHSLVHPHSCGTELIGCRVRGHRGRSERLTDACVYHRGCSRAGKDLARGGGGAGGRARGAAAITITVARTTAARTTVGRLQQG